MNPRQRRGAVFLVLAGLGAVAVFFSVVGYVNNVESEVGDRVPAFVVARQINAYADIRPADLREVQIPRRWLPDTAIQSLGDLQGSVSATTLAPGTLLQRSTIIPKPSLRPGQRELAIMVDAETGVAGKLLPGDRVDVWAVYERLGDLEEPRSKVIAQNLLVVGVGLPGQRERRVPDGALDKTAAVPVTFALGEQEIKALTFAEGVAKEIRLALRPPGDSTLVPGDRRSYVESLGITRDTTTRAGASATTPSDEQDEEDAS